jgi:hypothetical protein
VVTTTAFYHAVYIIATVIYVTYATSLFVRAKRANEQLKK